MVAYEDNKASFVIPQFTSLREEFLRPNPIWSSPHFAYTELFSTENCPLINGSQATYAGRR